MGVQRVSETVGKYLKEQREKLGISLEEIAEETKIQKRYLEDLENDEYEALPGEAYIKGFLRNYSALLKINSDEVIEMYKRMQNQNKEIEDNKDDEIEDIISAGKVKKINVLVLLLVLTVFISGIFMLVKNSLLTKKTENQDISKHVDKEDKVEIISKMNSDTNLSGEKKEEQPISIDNKLEKVFEINIKGDTWLEIKEGDKFVFNGFAFAGDKKIIKSENPIYMNIGKVSNVELKLNGIVLEIKGNEKDMLKKTWK
jgi:cytoskeletal protein RodZ